MLHGRSLLNNNVTEVTEFVEPNLRPNHRNKPLQGYIYRDVFDPAFFSVLKKNVTSILTQTNKNTHFTHGTTFRVGGDERKIIKHFQNNREQNVIYDLTFNEDWYYQTKDTIKDFTISNIRDKVSPIFQKCIHRIENLHPIFKEKDDWIFYRLHLNYLKYDTLLELHYDANPILSNKGIDHSGCRFNSITFYLYDHVEGMGGELWSSNGFVYKPKANSAIMINGNQSMHGVTANMNTDPRLAFTMRVAHKDDLYLPGHPSKYLYDVTNL